MRIREIKRIYEQLKNVIPISCEFELEGEPCLLAMLCTKDDTLCAYIFSHEIQPKPERKRRLNYTNRNVIYDGEINSNPLDSISSIELWGQTLTVHSSSSSAADYTNALIEQTALISFMQGKGVNFGTLEMYSPENLRMHELELDGDINELAAKSESKLKFAISFGVQTQTVPVKKCFMTHFNQKKTRKYIIKDAQSGQDYEFFSSGLIKYDIWEEAQTRFDSPKYKERFTVQELERIKKDYLAMLPGICPAGMVLALFEYETDEDIQLNVYTKKFLSEKAEEKSSATALFVKPDKPTGPNGKKLRLCVLNPIPRDTEEDMELELVSFYKHQLPKRIEF